MKKIFLLMMVTICSHGFAQKAGEKQLLSAIKVFQDAVDVNGMMEAITLFRKAGDQRPNDWMTAYWTSFVYSQTGRLTETPLPYYDSSQFFLDKIGDIEKLTANEQSDVFALQSLIYGLQAGPYWASGDRDNGLKFSTLENQALTKAILKNGENPRVWLLSGTGLIGDGLRNRNPGYMLAGKQMLEIAKLKYEAAVSENDLYPDWGKGWIDFWISRAKITED